MTGNLGLLFLICWPVLGGIVAYAMGRKNRDAANDVADIVTFVETFVFFALYFLALKGQETILKITGFGGMSLSLKIDGFHAIFGILVCVCWLFAGMYAKNHLSGVKNLPLYQMFSLWTMGMTAGVMISSGLLTLFTFLQLMALAIFPMFMLDGDEASMKIGMRYCVAMVIAAMISITGMTRLFFIIGSLNLDQFHDGMLAGYISGDVIFAAVMFLAGFMVQLGIALFVMWKKCSGEYADVNSGLLASVVTRTGMVGFVLITSNLMLGANSWGYGMLIAGLLIMLVTGFLAVSGKDLKKIVFYLSMNQIGLMFVGLAAMSFLKLNTATPSAGVLIVMASGMVVMTGLFLLVDAVALKCGTTKLSEIAGFGRKKPILMALYLVLAFGVCGVPFFGGYEGQSLIHFGLLEYMVENNTWYFQVANGVLYVALGLVLATMIKVFVTVFVSKNGEKQDDYDAMGKGVDGNQMIGIAVPAALTLVCGIVPNMTYGYLENVSLETLRSPGLDAINCLSGDYLLEFAKIAGVGILCYLIFGMLCKDKKMAAAVENVADTVETETEEAVAETEE